MPSASPIWWRERIRLSKLCRTSTSPMPLTSPTTAMSGRRTRGWGEARLNGSVAVLTTRASALAKGTLGMMPVLTASTAISFSVWMLAMRPCRYSDPRSTAAALNSIWSRM